MSYTQEEIEQLDEAAANARACRQGIAQLKAAMAVQIAQVRADYEASIGSLTDSQAEAEAQVLTIAQQVLEREGGLDTKLELPCRAQVTYVKSPDTWEWADDTAVLSWLQGSRPDLVRVKEEVDKVAVKKATVVMADGSVLDGTTGEVVPGVTVTAGTVEIKLKDGAK